MTHDVGNDFDHIDKITLRTKRLHWFKNKRHFEKILFICDIILMEKSCEIALIPKRKEI